MVSQANFIKKVMSEITFGGRIPSKIDKMRLADIIENTIEEFKDEDDRLTVRQYIIIENSAFHTPLFAKKRAVMFPECVKAVTDVKLSNKQYLNSGSVGIMDGDINSKTNLGVNISNGGYSLLQAIARASYIDYIDSLSLNSVSWDFNEFSHEFSVIGETPSADLVVEVYVYICDEAIYAMPDFYRYVVGKCYEDYSILTSFTRQKLLNEYDLDISRIEKKGQKYIEKVEKKWEQQKSEGDFIVEWE